MSAARSSTTFDTSMKWGQMSIVQKVAFMFKLAIMLITFGFAFPNLLVS